MKILLIYATNSGGTFVSSRIIKDVLGKKHSVVVKKAVETKPKDLAKYRLIIFGSPSWDFDGKEGQPHETMQALMNKLKKKKYKKKLFAVYGCGDSSFTHFCGAVDELEKFVGGLDGTLTIPSLRMDEFFYHLEKNKESVKKWAKQLDTVLKKI
jgi:flavodoxin I